MEIVFYTIEIDDRLIFDKIGEIRGERMIRSSLSSSSLEFFIRCCRLFGLSSSELVRFRLDIIDCDLSDFCFSNHTVAIRVKN